MRHADLVRGQGSQSDDRCWIATVSGREYMLDNSFQLVEIYDHLDAKIISGTHIIVGYSITNKAMLGSGRYRMGVKIQQLVCY